MQHFGRYELIRRISVGGMAEIFLARSSSLDGFEKELVIKRVRSDLSIDDTFASMFIEEGRVSISLSHPNIVQVFDFGEYQGAYYLAMEYIEGCNLEQLCHLDGIAKVGLDPPLALLIIAEVLKALDYAHNKRGRDNERLNLVHRDVSPHNVFISNDGTVKLGDFGVAKMRGRVTQTSPGMVMGKAAYMAPEHLRGKAIDCRSDIFSAGVVLWEALVGGALYAADVNAGIFDRILAAKIDPPSKRNSKLPASIDALVMGALAKEPGQRYSSAREFGQQIHAYLVKQYPQASLYDLQNFMSSHPDVLSKDGEKITRDTIVNIRQDSSNQPSGDESKLKNISLKESLQAPHEWSKDIQILSERFKQRPSLWVLLNLAKQCANEGDVASAMLCYRITAIKFAERGLLAQSLLCCRYMLALATQVEAAAMAPIIAAIPNNAGQQKSHTMANALAVGGPMADLLSELLIYAPTPANDSGQSTPLLAELDGTSFAELAGTAPLLTFSEGEAIVKQGDGGRTMFLIARGRVLVYATTPDKQRVYLSSLMAGDFFGENAFFTGSARSATVEAIAPTEVFEIDRQLYNNITAGHAKASGILLDFYKERIVETVLAKSPVFGLLDNEQRRSIVEHFVPRVFHDGELVVKEGAHSDQIYLIKDGEGEVFTGSGEQKVVLSSLGPGTLFGEIAALRGIARTASVIAKGKLEVLELSRNAFETILSITPELKQRILAVVSERTRSNMDKLLGGLRLMT
ncbi:MAG: cyclic nucleotide-binding domain-containing protein [Deltaproteobacteria bacterium]|nr:cyclic nucleotide-binding domain-containing protein [Deltaproteobacteria bacterium]